MIRSYIKIAWRNIKGSPLFSSINILGLTLSLAITTLLFLFVQHENSFNSSFSKKDQIYRILVDASKGSDSKIYATAPAMVAPTTIEDIPEVLVSLLILVQELKNLLNLPFIMQILVCSIFLISN